MSLPVLNQRWATATLICSLLDALANGSMSYWEVGKLVTTLECIYCTCTATTEAARAFAKLRFISKVFAVTLPLTKVCSSKRAVGAEASKEASWTLLFLF